MPFNIIGKVLSFLLNPWKVDEIQPRERSVIYAHIKMKTIGINLVWDELGTNFGRFSSHCTYKYEKPSFTPLSGRFSCQLLMKLIPFSGLTHENYTINISFYTI